MPLYEYKCEKCGQVFEVIQKFSDAPLRTHAACGGHVDRLLSAPAFHLKGTGWYATDYAKKNGINGSTHSSKTESSAKPAETKSEPTKSESTTSKSTEPAATKS